MWDFYPGSAGIPEEVQSLPKTSEGELIEKTLIHKIRDRKEGIVIYSFYTWFSFLTWVWVNIFLEIVSSKMATTHIFQSGVRNWPASVSRGEIEVFNPQAWDLRLRRESWQVYFVWTKLSSEALYWCHGVRQVQSTPLSISSTQHIWELSWLGTAQQFSHDMRAGEGGSGVTMICVPVNSI